MAFSQGAWNYLGGVSSSGDMIQDGTGNLCEGQDLARGVEFGGGPRHAVDDATGLVLGDRVPAELPQLEQPPGAVAAHASQQHRDLPERDPLRTTFRKCA